MARSKAATRALDYTPPLKRLYKVALDRGTSLVAINIRAHEYKEIDGNLQFYERTKHELRTVALIRFWTYVMEIEEDFGEKLEAIKKIDLPGELPENWGKVQ